ncbi:MAG: VTT domain-containing protein [Acidobacteria bacterium]|nr:VTT domain-containing protein [Acidobacteriota bacterium]
MQEWIEFFRRLLDVQAIIEWGGVLGITAIVFVETGLFFGFFLPGDSLLVTAGIIAGAGVLDIRLLILFATAAAIIGDQTGYVIGRRAGDALAVRYVKFRKHIERAHDFYEKYGAKTIVIARFVPIVRTFVPAVAGAARMKYRTFVTYNILGGIFWVFSTTLLGYSLGRVIPDIDRYLHLVIAIVVFLSLLPGIYEWWKHKKASALQ